MLSTYKHCPLTISEGQCFLLLSAYTPARHAEARASTLTALCCATFRLYAFAAEQLLGNLAVSLSNKLVDLYGLLNLSIG